MAKQMQPLCEATKRLFAPLKSELTADDVITVAMQENGKFLIDIYRLEIDRYSSTQTKSRRSSWALMELIRRLPEKKSVHSHGTYDAWEVPPTDSNIEIISQLIPRDRITFLDDAARMQFQLVLMQSKQSDTIAEMIAEFKQNKTVPDHGFEFSAEHPLSDYQQVALCAQAWSTGFGLFMEQGTGKTPIIIASACNKSIEIKKNNPKGFATVIVVCPNSVRANWLSEFETFATRGGRVTTLRGNYIDRLKLIYDAFAPDETGECYYSVVIMGYQTLYRSWQHLKGLPWSLGILDEGQGIKDSKAKQTKTCLELRDCCEQRAILTGTPIANSIMDLYTLLEFIEKGGSGFSSEKEFRAYYGVWENTQHGQLLLGTQNLPILQERLARKSFFISKKEALPNLPEKVYDIIECEMTEQQEEIYNKVASELAVEIEQEMDRDDIPRQLIVTNILTKLLRLNQITSGFVSWSPIIGINGDVEQPGHYEYFSPNPKLEEVMESLSTLDKTEKAIIWCNWLPDIDYFKAAFEQRGMKYCTIHGLNAHYTDADRQEAIRSYNYDRDCRFCVGTAASGGAGLNLLGYPKELADEYDTDTTDIYYFSQDWSYIKRAQSEDRGHRRGTRRNVRIHDAVIPGTIDEQIRKRVLGKKNTAMEAQDLREIMIALSAYKL